MKKALTILTTGVLLTGLLTFGSCKKDDNGKTCNELVAEVSAAAMNYSSNPNSSEYCNAYKDAMYAYIDGCDVVDPTLKEQYLAAIAGLNCDGK